MINRLSYVITICILLISVFSPGCDKTSVSEEEIAIYYELNKQNCLTMLKPVMYSDVEDERKELFKIVHISDAHLSPWSHGNHIKHPYNLKEAVLFANDTASRTNAMVATGDHISNGMKTTAREAMSYLTIFSYTLFLNNNIPTFTSTGNHDANMLNPEHPEYTLSKSDLYSHLTALINYPINSENNENYYYADLPNPLGGVVRIIALDVTDQENGLYSSQHNAILSQKQIDWLCHTAMKKDMTERHSVIILVHHPLPPADEDEFKGLVYNDFLHDWNMIPEIVEAFRTKQAISKKYRNKLNKLDSIAVDVSFADSPGEFVCYLGGHLHTFLHYEIRSSCDTELPNQLMIIANNMSPSEKSEKSHIERSNTGLRNNTFNLYAIDTKRKVIYVTFFGATSFYYQQVIALNYL